MTARVELPSRRLIVALAAFSAVSAIGGATELVVWREGNRYLPLTLLENTSFESFLIPGLLLGIVVGGSSLACAMLAWRRSNAAVDATILAGGAMTVWIGAEVAMMRGFHALHGIYGGLGAALLVLGLRAARRLPSPRRKWVILPSRLSCWSSPASSKGLRSERVRHGPSRCRCNGRVTLCSRHSAPASSGPASWS